MSKRLAQAAVVFAGLVSGGAAMVVVGSRLVAGTNGGVLMHIGTAVVGGALAFFLVEGFGAAGARQ